MWRIITCILLWNIADSKLLGGNICREEQLVKINVTVVVQRNATVRQYQWCMNVPPRCSFYTTRLVNHSQLLEREVTDLVEKCCPGFYENKTSNSCEKECNRCINGHCLGGHCLCSGGFKGATCIEECDLMEWGENCANKCNCHQQGSTCNSKTGTCNCPPGWNGSQCQEPCSGGTFGPNCDEKCQCSQIELCSHVTGACSSSNTTQLVTSSVNGSTNQPNSDETKTNTVLVQNNGRFTTNNIGLVPSVLTTDGSNFDQASVTLVPPHLQNDAIPETELPIGEFNANKEINKRQENYMDATDELDHANPKQMNKDDLVNSASAATAVSITIIIVAAVIVGASRWKRRKSRQGVAKAGMSTVSVVTHSIFHTPLPDPPPFENPVFATPIEPGPQVAVEGQRFEARVVCSMQFPAPKVGEYLYDHPPSTGSYRAVSIPEPPDINALEAQNEPVYDEIPSGIATPISEPPPSYKLASLYMNTCAKTRL